MMIYEISPAIRGLLLTGTLILCFAGIFCVIAALLQRRGAKRAVWSGILLLCGYLLFQLQFRLAHDMFYGSSLPVWSKAPAAALLLPLALLTALTGKTVFDLSQWRKEHIYPGAVKESIDQLPTGLCFCSEDGSVLLSNQKIDRLCRAATGEALLDARAFWEAVGQSGFLHPDDGSVWSLDRRILHTDLGDVYQITATDITHQHALSQELERDRLRLRDINRRLRQYGETVAEVTQEKELLAAKIRVHDGLGQCLLAAKRCILTTVTREEKSETLKLWRQNIALIQTPPEQSVETDGLADLLAAAKAVGVSILFTGSLPSVGTTARMLTEAVVHECLTNTVRHAGGNELYVEISQEGPQWTIRCTNNGTPPGGPIQEGGGLSSLRRRVIQAGGTMRVEAAPRFMLSLTIEEGGSL